MNQAQFRIGFVYATQRGDIVRLHPVAETYHSAKWERAHPGHTFAHARLVFEDDPVGYVSVVNGRYCRAMANEVSSDHLVPGELQFKDGQWVAVEEDKQIDPRFAAAHYGHDLIPAVQEEKPATPEPTPTAAVPEWLRQLRIVHAAQGFDGTWNADEYMLGMFNGLELALAIAENRDPQYRQLKPQQDAPESTAKPALAALTLLSDVHAPLHGSAHLVGSAI